MIKKCRYCEEPVFARQRCRKHWEKWKVENPHLLRKIVSTKIKLKWIEDNYLADPNGPCVIWPFDFNRDGYGRGVYIDGKRVPPHAHATALRDGPCPNGMETIHGPCHNRACIIHTRWGTKTENAADRVRDGTDSRGERQGASKLTRKDVIEIRRLRNEGLSQRNIAAKYHVSRIQVRNIDRRKSWGWLED